MALTRMLLFWAKKQGCALEAPGCYTRLTLNLPLDDWKNLLPPPPPGGTPLYGLYSYVQHQRVGFFSHFVHKQGIDFGHFAAILVINRVSIFALYS